jgi:predicted ATPase/class 3 adenylate cyclase
MPDLPTGTVTFLFTDIEGSTKLWEQYPDAMRHTLVRHDALLHKVIEQHQGHVFKTVGDAFCAVFSSAENAVAAALTAQRALQAQDWGPVGAIRVRMALHRGTSDKRGGDYFGPTVNRVARLLSVGHGEQVLLSSALEAIVRDRLPPGANLRDLGSHRLKDLQQPEHIFQLVHPSLPADFPPLHSLQAFANNLPVQLTSFIGREWEMAEVKRLLATTRLLTLTGTGGCGKTRLALQIGAESLSDYADGVWCVELAALSDPSLAPQAVASALGVREEPNRPILSTLSDHLRSKSLLLILDNCEHLVTACAQVAETLLRTCPNLRVLATSREALNVMGETTWRVPSLSLPDLKQWSMVNGQWSMPSAMTQYDAVRLFVERARASRPDFAMTGQNASAVVQLCHRLDGIPLAMELAAARVRALSVEQIEARLGDRFALLTSGNRMALPRHQTLRATIDWSYDLLTEAERVSLRRLSVFADGWTLEAAERVTSDEWRVTSDTTLDSRFSTPDTFDVLDLLLRLVDKSLVIADTQNSEAEVRYHMLETVRQYGWERLREAGEWEPVRGHHRDYFLRGCQEITSRI